VLRLMAEHKREARENRARTRRCDPSIRLLLRATLLHRMCGRGRRKSRGSQKTCLRREITCPLVDEVEVNGS